MELHLVHINEVNSSLYSVVSLLFEIDPYNRTDVFDKIDFTSDSKNATFPFPWNLENKFVYHYEGSLTTPNCDQTVDWFIYIDPIPIKK
jgi:carbonic anhydrase